MLRQILLVVSQTKTVHIVGERAETALEGKRDIGAAKMRVSHDIINLQVAVKIGTLAFDVCLYLDSGLFHLLILVIICLFVAAFGDVGFR